MNLTGPLDPNALVQARALALPEVADGQFLQRLYLHWSVEVPTWNEPGFYNIIVLQAGDVWKPVVAQSPLDNARKLSADSSGYAAHTFERNSFALGLAVNGMEGASPADFGPYALQEHAVEVLCAAAAKCCLEYLIYPLDVVPADEERPGELLIMTHAEAAIIDKYAPTTQPPPSDGVTRWDLWRLLPSPHPLIEEEAHLTGDLLRSRINAYLTPLLREEVIT